jgi:MFS family permease
MLNAQQLAPVAVSGRMAAQPSPYQPSVQHDSPRRSTGFERFAWGLVAGMVPALIADQAAEEMDRGAALAIYGVGALVGVGLVTGAREGLRPPRLLAGWAAGVAVGVAAAVIACETDQDAAGGCQLSGQTVGSLLFVVAVPLGASLGHGSGR